MDVQKLSEDEVRKRLNGLIEVNDYSYECQNCSLPVLLHKGTCTQSNPADEKEECQVWKNFRNKLKPKVAKVESESKVRRQRHKQEHQTWQEW